MKPAGICKFEISGLRTFMMVRVFVNKLIWQLHFNGFTGTRVEIPSVLNHLGHNVTIAGHLGSTGFYPDVWQHPGIFIHKNISRVIDNYKLAGAELSEKQIEENFNFFKSQSEIAQTDAFVCSFPASMCELWAPFNKTIIFATSHRYNLGRCRLSAWNNLDSLLQVSQSKQSIANFLFCYVILAGNLIYEQSNDISKIQYYS